MGFWRAARAMSWSARAVVALALLAAVLVAAIPVALLAGLVLMLFGHVIGGLALFGGSILAAIAAVTIASMSGVRHLRKMIRQRTAGGEQRFRVVQLGRGDYNFD